MVEKTYVYDGMEVKQTGRTAVRHGVKLARLALLVEIVPVDTSIDWKKWVSPDQLYEVREKRDVD